MSDHCHDACPMLACSECRYQPEPTPKWADLFGIDPDYTDGVPVDEFLERNRGEA